MAIGAGQQASIGDTVTLPAGYIAANLLGICTPGGFVEAGRHFQGIQECAFFGLTPYLNYLDDSGNLWSGVCNWMAASWR